MLTAESSGGGVVVLPVTLVRHLRESVWCVPSWRVDGGSCRWLCVVGWGDVWCDGPCTSSNSQQCAQQNYCHCVVLVVWCGSRWMVGPCRWLCVLVEGHEDRPLYRPLDLHTQPPAGTCTPLPPALHCMAACTALLGVDRCSTCVTFV